MQLDPKDRPVIALVHGDPTGIGPEQTARILAKPQTRQIARILLVGDVRVVEMGMRQAGVDLKIQLITDPATADYDAQAIPMLDLGNIDPSKVILGAPDPAIGFCVGATLSAAVDLVKQGHVQGVCFAPLHKKAMYDGGWKFADEHQLFAHLINHKGPFREMNVLDGQWMSRVTSHVSLRGALDEITYDNICSTLSLTDRVLRNAGINNPRIAVAALNPHGGEGGLFGDEEITIIAPAVRDMAAKGINCKGPFPSDTVYLKAFAGEYDSVLAMYHDQGQIATKQRGFNKGVTVTTGLAAVFTTPAHGTAYDIVGQGIADTGAIENALALAVKLAKAQLNTVQQGHVA
jgi:4-hydroxythreonine-4-phosphate dehydrogenase